MNVWWQLDIFGVPVLRVTHNQRPTPPATVVGDADDGRWEQAGELADDILGLRRWWPWRS